MKKRKHPVEEHYEIILESIADGVFTVNLDFEITSFDRAAEVIPGFPSKGHWENGAVRCCRPMFVKPGAF